MKDKLKNLILSAQFEMAEQMCKKVAEEEIRDIILDIAYDTENICIYTFGVYMMNHYNKEWWMKLIIDVMLNPLCFLEGAYSVALYHSKELLKLNSSVENMERVLFFYEIPEKLLTISEAAKIAEDILCIDPTNKVALNFIG